MPILLYIVIVSALGVFLTPRMTEQNSCLIKHARSSCCFLLLRVLVVALLIEFGMKHPMDVLWKSLGAVHTPWYLRIDAAHCCFW